MSEMQIGVVKHYFGKVGVGAIEITNGELVVGDTVHIKGHTTDLMTSIESMQIEHEKVQSVKTGDNVGIQVPDKIHEHDKVFKVLPD